MNNLHETWVYLSATPLFHLTLTLTAYQSAVWIFEKSSRNPILNPVLIAVLILLGVLKIFDTDYETYFEGAQFVHFLLGPATVALALPLYQHWSKIRQSVLAISVSLSVGSVTAILSAISIAWVLGASETLLASIAPKSTTAPVAMALARELGGLPSLTAVIVILTGIFGAMIATGLLNLIGAEDWRARGFAIGTASHGIGTSRALQVNQIAGAFAGLAMGLNALATAILVPTLWSMVGSW